MSLARTYTEEQLIEHGEMIAEWLMKGRPQMQFSNTVTDGWVDVVSYPSWATGTEYRFKPEPITLYQIIDIKTGWPRAGSVSKAKMEARAACLNAPLTDSTRYQVIKMVQVPDDEC